MTSPPTSRTDEARALAALFAPDHATPAAPPDPERFAAWVEATRVRLGLERPAPLVTAVPSGEPDDPRELAYFLLRMAEATYARLIDPLPVADPALEARLARLLADRPNADEAHCQMPIDAASSLARARAALDRAANREGPILALGDDDGVTVALALLGATDVIALDIDPALLDFLERAVADAGGALRTYERDFFEDELPDAAEGRCAVVLTDPIRSFGPCLAFLDVAERCLAPDGVVLYADHPEWNYELDRVLASIGSLGLACTGVAPLVHRYPITSTWVPDPDAKARALGVSPAWMRELVARVSAYTNLYALEHARKR